MKIFNQKSVSVLVLSIILLLAGCDDYDTVQVESEANNQVDFSTYVAVGNSLTAGFQSNALYRNAQVYSYPNLLAQQMHIVDNFEQPLVSEPGLGQRIQLDDDLNPTSTGDGSGILLNNNLNRPFNNLGIPGSILADFTGTDLPGLPYTARQESSPFYELVLKGMGNTQAEEMAALNPTFVTFWLGNNDVLGYVTSGGSTAYTPPGAQGFAGLYQASMQQIAATGANAVVYNIPNITTIPFVFLINQSLLQDGTITINEQGNFALVTPNGNVPVWIQRTDPANPGAIRDTVQMAAPNPQAGNPGSFFLLSAQSQLSNLFGQGVGLSPQNPIPSALVLDDGEALQAISLVNQYNASIANLAQANGFSMVDINGLFTDIVADGGVNLNGIELGLAPGRNSLFSFDGVHPSNRGYAIIANETIVIINNAYGTNLTPIDISTIPEGLPVTSE